MCNSAGDSRKARQRRTKRRKCGKKKECVLPPQPPWSPDQETDAPDTDAALKDYADSDTDASDETRMFRATRAYALSDEYKQTHWPTMPEHCDICRRSRQQKKKLARRPQRTYTKFGDPITCDHILMKDISSHPGT